MSPPSGENGSSSPTGPKVPTSENGTSDPFSPDQPLINKLSDGISVIESPLSLSRCVDPDGEILDDCWVAELPELAKSHLDLQPFFPDPAYSTVEIYVAGKNRNPNERALAVAMESIEALADTLRQLTAHAGVPSADWNFTTIWVPYQTVRIFYTRFWSEYGADLDVAIKPDDCPFGSRGILSPSNTADSSIASVPSTVKYLLTELTSKMGETDPEFNELRAQVNEEEIMGVEILAPIINLVDRHRHSLPLADHYLTLLAYVQHHSTGG